MTLTPHQIGDLAPDSQVLSAGQKLGKPSHWQGLGRRGTTIWGECRGGAVYQVRAEAAAMGYKCSCPSRKQPCKHVIGLLTLAADHPPSLTETAPPDWVSEWLARREARAQRSAKVSASEVQETPDAELETAAEADGKAPRGATQQKARRRQERQTRIMEGIDALELWMSDMVRNGLALVETQPAAFWQRQAARLVDAEAPGLASWVRRLSSIPGSSPCWPEVLLGELGRLALLIHAYRRVDELDPLLQHDVRALVGWRLTKEEVGALGERVTDEWITLGQVVEEEDQLRVQRTWLRGLRSGRIAVVLQFVAGKTAGFPWVATLNHVQEMELHFWPGAWPQRALIARRFGDSRYSEERRPGYAAIEDMLEDAARALAANPWIARFLAVLHDVVPMKNGDTWLVRDRTGAALPLQPRSHWSMLAQSGGHPIDVHGEWDGAVLHTFALRIAETEPC